MLFHLRNKKRRRGRHTKKRREWFHHLQEWVWPSMGWYEALRFFEIRVKRQKGSVEYVAKGLAIGVATSFLPFIGFHLAIILAACFIMRSSMIAGVVGSLVGNPWTFPVIWLWCYNLGQLILGSGMHVESIPFELSFEAITTNFMMFWWEVLWPMTVGGVPTGLLLGFMTFYLTMIHVKSYRAARAKFITSRREQNKHRFRDIAAEKAAALKDKIVHIKDIRHKDDEQ